LNYKDLETTLNYTFNDPELLIEALTHKSFLSAEKKSYERLEFLGDAVLDLAISKLLIEKNPEDKEGILSQKRAGLVNSDTLSSLAIELNIHKLIISAEYEKSEDGFVYKKSILEDVFEAMLGAIYLDSNFDISFKIISQIYINRIDQVEVSDPKTELQMLCQEKGIPLPDYQLEYIEGPEHDPTFIYKILIQEKYFGHGSGDTKKSAQQAVAKLALEKLRK